MLADGLGTALLRRRLVEAQLALALIDGALLLLHLTEEREEAGGLLLGEAGRLGDELLLLGIELGGIEALLALCVSNIGQNEHQQK